MKNRLLFIVTSLVVAASLAACAGPLSGITAAPLLSVDTAVQPAGNTQTTAAEPAAQVQAQTPSRQVVVLGTGKVTLVPDVAYINIGVNTQSKNVAEALASNNQQSQALKDILKKMGVENKDIQTTSFNIYPQQQYDSSNQVIGTLYVVDNIVSLTVHNLPKLGEMLDAAVRAGANSINSIQFDVEDKDKALSEARQQAVQKAQLQAEELAKAAGVELGQILTINVLNANSPVPMYGMGGGGFAQAASTVPVSAGQLVLTVDVSVTYEIK
jgi:uncharacterized protein